MAAVRILVTGGAGFIGSHACKALRRSGHTPVVFDNFSRGSRELVKWGDYVEGDLLDPKAIDHAIGAIKPDAVMHFAALAYVEESAREPDTYYLNNVAGSINLLRAMHEHAVDKIIFSSTCATYGVPKSVPIRDDDPQEPINPYGRSKLFVEKILRDMDAAHGMRSVSLRYFNASGADPDGETGECHEPETHLIPLAFEAARGKRDYLQVLGEDYETPDGTCIRDYVHVSDLAAAHVLALNYLTEDGATCSFALGSGKGHSVREVISAVESVTKLKVPVRSCPRRPGDPPVLVCQSYRAREVLGWRPVYADLQTHIAHAWAWTCR